MLCFRKITDTGTEESVTTTKKRLLRRLKEGDTESGLYQELYQAEDIQGMDCLPLCIKYMERYEDYQENDRSQIVSVRWLAGRLYPWEGELKTVS